nr:hypothetical protein [Tanacetum cinerariifolium]
MNDSMIELRETFQAWLQQQEQLVNLDSYIPEPSQCQKIPIYYDDDGEEECSIPLRDIIISELPPCIAITPVLSTKELVDSLIMEDEHLDTILAMELDEVIKYSVEELVPIPSEFEGISDDTDDDLIKDIDYVEASPPDSESVSLEEVKDEILREKLLKIHFLNAKIESLNDNPTPDRVLKSPSPFPIPIKDSDSFFEKSDTSLSYSDNSLPEFKTFSNHMEERSSGGTTTHADNSLPKIAWILKTRTRGFVLRSLDLQILSFILGI